MSDCASPAPLWSPSSTTMPRSSWDGSIRCWLRWTPMPARSGWAGRLCRAGEPRAGGSATSCSGSSGARIAGHREDSGPIRNPIGCNMAFRRDILTAVGGFATQFGKRGNALETCDETELALRIERSYGPGRIRFAPGARVRHFVPADRISWRLLLRRSLSEGLSKGRIRRMYRRPALAPERDYARMLVLEAIPRMLLGGIGKRDRDLVAGAGAVLLSLLVTGGAFVFGAALAEFRGRPGSKRHRDGAHDGEVEYGAAATPVWRTTRGEGGGSGDRSRRSEAGDVTKPDTRAGRVRDGSIR